MREYIGGKEDDDTRNVTDRCVTLCWGFMPYAISVQPIMPS